MKAMLRIDASSSAPGDSTISHRACTALNNRLLEPAHAGANEAGIGCHHSAVPAASGHQQTPGHARKGSLWS